MEQVKAVVVGHAIGDAIGVPVEFISREILEQDPVVDMREYGTHGMPRGSWSDDTSMTLCELDAFEGAQFDFDKIMNNFARWFYHDEYTPTGMLFDAGGTCGKAIANYVLEHKPWQECGINTESSNGNGSLMRIHPFALYTHAFDASTEEKIQYVESASALTHAHPISKTACGIYTFVLWELLDSPVPESISIGLQKAKKYYINKKNEVIGHFSRLLDEDFAQTEKDDIESGGYAVDTLEASVWCLQTTENYRDCILKAVNLGKDTDTVGAIAGGLAGALYGYDAIPQEWKDALLKREYVENLSEKLQPVLDGKVKLLSTFLKI